MELPPDVRQALDDLEPLPGEDELAFAERLREAESDALEQSFLTEAALWERYTNELYRLGDPTSHHRAEARKQVSAMTPVQREALLQWALGKPGLPMPPQFWPASQAAPYDGPDAEPPPADFRWVDPELYYLPSE
jgi:hypothetical protein